MTRISLAYPLGGLATVVALGMSLGAVSGQEGADVENLIPHHRLGLVHAPEVHQELQLTSTQIERLESLFQKIDGRWLRARNLPPDQNAAVILELENAVANWFRENTDTGQQKRLRQLEYRTQGTRMLLRDDVKRALNLSERQVKSILALAVATSESQANLQQAEKQNEVTDEMRDELTRAQQAEQQVFVEVLTPEQIAKLGELLGDAFDTRGLKRIFPMAPELLLVKNWVNSKPLRLQELRGKVVLLHFYAFQCHNCKANFDVYRRWHAKYGDDVMVIGIQTPETALERDPLAVTKAAKDEDLDFPILIDLESANWKNWSNTMWPTVYVIDQKGYLRQWWQGELRWEGATGDKTIEKLVDGLLAEAAE